MTRIVVVSRYVCIRSKFSELCFSFFFGLIEKQEQSKLDWINELQSDCLRVEKAYFSEGRI